MTGLLDFFKTPEGQGLLAGAFGGLANAHRGTPLNNIGKAGMAGLMGYTGANDRAEELLNGAQKRKFMQSQTDENTAQIAQRDAAMKKATSIQEAMPGLMGFTSPGAFVTPPVDGQGPVMPMSAAPKPQFDVPRAQMLGMDPDLITKYANLANLGRPEVARTMKGVGADNKEFEQQFDKYGGTVGERITQFKAPHYQDLGGSVGVFDGYGNRTGGIGKSQTMDSQASNQVTMRGQDMTNDRSRENINLAMSKPFEVTDENNKPVLVRQDKQGNILPVQGYQPKNLEKPLTPAALKTLTEARDNYTTMDSLSSSFKKNYGDKGILGIGADASMMGKSIFGTDKDSVEWWKNYRKQVELTERHALFGAALTPGELASWRSADIGPNMDAGVIERNLKTRAELTQKVFDTTSQDLIDAGQNETRVRAITNRATNKPDAGGNSVRTPDGKNITFPNAAAAAQFRKAAGL